MKVTATELMKQLKFIEEEINEIHHDDEEKSTVLVEKHNDGNFKSSLVPVYEEEYDFFANRNRIKELHEEERKIRNILSVFNSSTLVDGFDFTISEGLVRITELKSEIKVLTNLAKKKQFSSSNNYLNNEVIIYKASYSIDDAKKVLRASQRELSALQVAIDKTNLNSEIEMKY